MLFFHITEIHRYHFTRFPKLSLQVLWCSGNWNYLRCQILYESYSFHHENYEVLNESDKYKQNYLFFLQKKLWQQRKNTKISLANHSYYFTSKNYSNFINRINCGKKHQSGFASLQNVNIQKSRPISVTFQTFPISPQIFSKRAKRWANT